MNPLIKIISSVGNPIATGLSECATARHSPYDGVGAGRVGHICPGDTFELIDKVWVRAYMSDDLETWLKVKAVKVIYRGNFWGGWVKESQISYEVIE